MYDVLWDIPTSDYWDSERHRNHEKDNRSISNPSAWLRLFHVSFRRASRRAGRSNILFHAARLYRKWPSGFMGTLRKPSVQFVCPEFGGGSFFPRQGWGWATDYPGGDCKFMGGIHRLTGIRVHPHPNVVGILDKELFQFPFVYAVEVGGMYLSDAEAARLREYLLRGGFLHVDDFWGLRQKASFESRCERSFRTATWFNWI